MFKRDLEGLREYSGDAEELESWINYIQLWADSTKVEETRRGPTLLLTLSGKLEQLTDHTDPVNGINRQRLKATKWFAGRPEVPEVTTGGVVVQAAVPGLEEGPQGDQTQPLSYGVDYLIDKVREIVKPNPAMILCSEYRALVEWKKAPSMSLAEYKLSFFRLMRALETDSLGNFKFPPVLVALMFLEKANLGQDLWHETVQHLPVGLHGLTAENVEAALERVIGTRKLNDAQRMRAFMRAGRYDRSGQTQPRAHARQAQAWPEENEESRSLQAQSWDTWDSWDYTRQAQAWPEDDEDQSRSYQAQSWDTWEPWSEPWDEAWEDANWGEDAYRAFKGKSKKGFQSKAKGAKKGQQWKGPEAPKGKKLDAQPSKGSPAVARMADGSGFVVVEGVAYPIAGAHFGGGKGKAPPFSDDEKNRRYRLGLCFVCGKDGHKKGDALCPGPPQREASRGASAVSESDF